MANPEITVTLYVALVSHDDEHDVIVLEITNTAESAKLVCEQEAKLNGDDLLEWNEHQGVPDEHTRIPGQFWTSSNTHYIYYVRPVSLKCTIRPVRIK